MKYDSERKYVEYVKSTLEKLNYNIWTEVVPDQCVMWDRPYRVDMIVYHPTEGYIGIEAKNINTLRQGSILSDAIDQIQTYRGYTYSGIKINKWCIAVPESDYSYLNKDESLKEIKSFVINFIKKRYNISFMNELVIDECTKNRIDFYSLQSKDKNVIGLRQFNMDKLKKPNADEVETEWYCQRCGYKNYNCICDDKCDFCNSSRYICPHCDREYDIEDKLCEYCGFELEVQYD